jgi:hypothetical protein
MELDNEEKYEDFSLLENWKNILQNKNCQQVFIVKALKKKTKARQKWTLDKLNIFNIYIYIYIIYIYLIRNHLIKR